MTMRTSKVWRALRPAARLSAEHSLDHSLNALCIATEAEIQHIPSSIITSQAFLYSTLSVGFLTFDCCQAQYSSTASSRRPGILRRFIGVDFKGTSRAGVLAEDAKWEV